MLHLPLWLGFRSAGTYWNPCGSERPLGSFANQVMTSFIYPMVVAWTWGGGWLAVFEGVGYMDFAGTVRSGAKNERYEALLAAGNPGTRWWKLPREKPGGVVAVLSFSFFFWVECLSREDWSFSWRCCLFDWIYRGSLWSIGHAFVVAGFCSDRQCMKTDTPKLQRRTGNGPEK